MGKSQPPATRSDGGVQQEDGPNKPHCDDEKEVQHGAEFLCARMYAEHPELDDEAHRRLTGKGYPPRMSAELEGSDGGDQQEEGESAEQQQDAGAHHDCHVEAEEVQAAAEVLCNRIPQVEVAELSSKDEVQAQQLAPAGRVEAANIVTSPIAATALAALLGLAALAVIGSRRSHSGPHEQGMIRSLVQDSDGDRLPAETESVE